MKDVYEPEYLQMGLKIAYYRKLRGLTQEELAERIDRNAAYIGHVEAPNISKAVSLDALFDIAYRENILLLFGNCPKNGILHLVGILILIHHDFPIAG